MTRRKGDTIRIHESAGCECALCARFARLLGMRDHTSAMAALRARREQEGRHMMKVLDDVRAERARQNARWGEQNHAPAVWIAILTEEVGEAAREALALTFGEMDEGTGAVLNRWRAELIQCAAVAVAAVEALDRTSTGGTP